MRIYNGTNARISLPYPGKRVEVGAHSVSGDIGANTEVISLLVTGYGVEEVAIIVSGPYELNLCSSIPTVTSYVVQSIEEAIERFSPKKKEEPKKVVVEAQKAEEPSPIVEEEEPKKMLASDLASELEDEDQCFFPVGDRADDEEIVNEEEPHDELREAKKIAFNAKKHKKH